jgi:DNA ligase (NAD+)
MAEDISKGEYKKLVKEIKKHDSLYYQYADPIISDYAYDLLVKKLEHIEKLHPNWVENNSPTATIPTDSIGKFKSCEHLIPMLSLSNTYSEEEVEAFIHRVEKLTEKENLEFNVELKMDGVALSVIYEDGKLLQAVTRGNGKKGDDVTSNAFGIVNLPHKLLEKSKGRLDLRGEVYLPLKEFERLNKQRQEEGLELYANPRNAASGALKLLDPEISKSRGLHIMIYDLVNPPKQIKLQSEIAPYLKSMGLPTFTKEYSSRVSSSKEVLSFANKIEKKRADLPFEIDGIVVKVDNLEQREIIGVTNKSPRYAVAYKFGAKRAETVIESITVQVGRTGVLTPVANLKAVLLSGSTISRATLHNFEEIERKDIREKDTVIIEKGGDVIPKIISVVIKDGHKRSNKWKIPKFCPNCGAHVIQKEGEVAVRCSAGEKCSGQYLARIKHFVSKGAMDIAEFGVKIVERFYELGLLNSLEDIYKLKKEDLIDLEGFKDRSIKVLLDNIEKSKECELYRFIFSLGIPYVGIVAAKEIAEYVKDVDSLLKISKIELLTIDGVGEKVADSITSYFSKQEHIKEIKALLKLGVTPLKIVKKQSGHLFFGKTFVITGTFSNFTRKEVENLIEERGGKVTSSISKLTNYLVLGENPGSKYEKAIKLKVNIIDQQGLLDFL